jgi:hypothetical protein
MGEKASRSLIKVRTRFCFPGSMFNLKMGLAGRHNSLIYGLAALNVANSVSRVRGMLAVELSVYAR